MHWLLGGDSARASPGLPRHCQGKGWVYSTVKARGRAASGPPEPHLPESAGKVGHNICAPWRQASLKTLGRNAWVEDRWPDNPILEGVGKKRCPAQSQPGVRGSHTGQKPKLPPSPAREGNLGNPSSGRWGGILCHQGQGLCMSWAKKTIPVILRGPEK